MVEPKHKKAGFWIKNGIFNDISTFSEFESRIEALKDETEQGDVFEVFIEGFLNNHHLFQCNNHWVVGNILLKIREKLIFI